MRFKLLWLTLKGDYQAWKRGEKRIAPAGATGRIYKKKNGASAQAVKNVKGNTKLKSVGAKITRADGTVEHLVLENGTFRRVD